MTVFDYIVLIILGASALIGIWRGFVSEVIALFAWMVALLAAWLYAPTFASLFDTAIQDLFWRQVAAFVAIFITVLILAALLRFLMRELLTMIGLRPLDRILGMVFGIARGIVIAMLFVLAGSLVGMPKEPWWSQALLAPPLETAVIAVKPWLPEAIAARVQFR